MAIWDKVPPPWTRHDAGLGPDCPAGNPSQPDGAGSASASAQPTVEGFQRSKATQHDVATRPPHVGPPWIGQSRSRPARPTSEEHGAAPQSASLKRQHRFDEAAPSSAGGGEGSPHAPDARSHRQDGRRPGLRPCLRGAGPRRVDSPQGGAGLPRHRRGHQRRPDLYLRPGDRDRHVPGDQHPVPAGARPVDGGRARRSSPTTTAPAARSSA